MKIHELRPAAGSHRARTRVGRGIAAGKGKTAGRGTKGQKARAGGSIPPWFEGGQTPLHMRIPKLRGFKRRFSVEYEVVNIGAIASLVELGAFESGEPAGSASKASKPKSAAPITVNQDILRGVGLVRTLNKPLKILGGGDLSTALFVVADAFSKSAVAKIEAAGGSVSVLEVPTESRPAIGVDGAESKPSKASKAPKAAQASIEAAVPEAAAEPAAATEPTTVEPATDESTAESVAAVEDAPEGDAPVEETRAPRRGRARAATPAAESERETDAEDAAPSAQSTAATDESTETPDGA
jgi:large subunit ribosomal protein L15